MKYIKVARETWTFSSYEHFASLSSWSDLKEWMELSSFAKNYKNFFELFDDHKFNFDILRRQIKSIFSNNSNFLHNSWSIALQKSKVHKREKKINSVLCIFQYKRELTF